MSTSTLKLRFELFTDKGLERELESRKNHLERLNEGREQIKETVAIQQASLRTVNNNISAVKDIIGQIEHEQAQRRVRKQETCDHRWTLKETVTRVWAGFECEHCGQAMYVKPGDPVEFAIRRD